jgi:hypothetical protein
MEYTDIPKDIKNFVRKSTYLSMTEEEQMLYLKCVKRLMRKLDELHEDSDDDTSQDDYREITFVGMRFRGDHRFSSKDVVKLEKDDNNPKDPNAVKVMMKVNKRWNHVAYVCREDAKWLRTINGFETLLLEHVSNFAQSTAYNIKLVTQLPSRSHSPNFPHLDKSDRKYTTNDDYDESSDEEFSAFEKMCMNDPF